MGFLPSRSGAQLGFEFSHGPMKRGVQIDAVGVGDCEHAPEAVGEFVSETGVEIGRRVAKARAHHDEFIERADIGGETLSELDGSPRPAAGGDVGGIETRADFEGALSKCSEGRGHGGFFRKLTLACNPERRLTSQKGRLIAFIVYESRPDTPPLRSVQSWFYPQRERGDFHGVALFAQERTGDGGADGKHAD